jgi:hypothetical protein
VKQISEDANEEEKYLKPFEIVELGTYLYQKKLI